MPLLLPIGPLTLVATFGNGILSLRLAVAFPTFHDFIYVYVGFTPALGSFNIALLLHYAYWIQLVGRYYCGRGLTTKYNSILAIAPIFSEMPSCLFYAKTRRGFPQCMMTARYSESPRPLSITTLACMTTIIKRRGRLLFDGYMDSRF